MWCCIIMRFGMHQFYRLVNNLTDYDPKIAHASTYQKKKKLHMQVILGHSTKSKKK